MTIAALKPFLEPQLSRIPQKSLLAEEIRYALSHWPGLIRFIDDGTLECDNNPVENQIRPIALTRGTPSQPETRSATRTGPCESVRSSVYE